MRRAVIVALVSVALASPAAAVGRPSDCPSPWCACWLWHHLGVQPERAKALGLNLTLNWRRERAEPRAGAIGFRHRSGGGHVGVVVSVVDGGVMLLSGNHNGVVAEALYPMRGMTFWSPP